MSGSREPRAANVVSDVVVTRRARSKRAGPLAGWAWRDARLAVQFGKRQGAWAVELRPTCARFLMERRCQQQSVSGPPAGGARRTDGRRDESSRRPAQPPRLDPKPTGTPDKGVLSKRKLKSATRLQELPAAEADPWLLAYTYPEILD